MNPVASAVRRMWTQGLRNAGVVGLRAGVELRRQSLGPRPRTFCGDPRTSALASIADRSIQHPVIALRTDADGGLGSRCAPHGVRDDCDRSRRADFNLLRWSGATGFGASRIFSASFTGSTAQALGRGSRNSGMLPAWQHGFASGKGTARPIRLRPIMTNESGTRLANIFSVARAMAFDWPPPRHLLPG